MLLWASAALLTDAAEPGRGHNDAKTGLLRMLQQPCRASAVHQTQDGAGRSVASAALRDASRQQASAAGTSTAPRADAVPDGAMGAPASGAKAFLEAAKRILDKAEYARVRSCAGRLPCRRESLTVCACLLQFQSLLKAFKSETLSFEDLLAGTGQTPACSDAL